MAVSALCLFLLADLATGVMVVDEIGVGKVKPLCIDADGDRLSDRWQEVLLAGKTGNDALPGGDADQDGITNLDEFYAGTDPDDVNSLMRIVSIDLASESSSDLVIKFEGGGFNGPTQYVGVGDAPVRTFTIRGGADPDGTMSVQGSMGGLLQVTNSWTHTNAVVGTAQRFYKIAVAMAGNAQTNSQAWAMFTQARADNSRYLASVPLDFGTNNTLDSLLGTHLARGLHAGADNPSADEIQFRDAQGNYQTCYLRDDGGNAVWYYQGQPATQAVEVGQAFWLTRKSGARARTNMVLVGSCRTNTSFDIGFTTNNVSQGWDWQLFGWPHSKAASFTGTVSNEFGLASLAYGNGSASPTAPHDRMGDQIWLWDEEDQGWRYYWLVDGVNATVNGKWWDSVNRRAATFDLAPGKGYFFRHHVTTSGAPTGTNFTWEAARP